MADLVPGLNTSEIFNGVWASMPPQFSSGFGFLITISKAIGIAFLVYMIFLIIRAIVQIRQALRMKVLAQNVAEINQKLSLLVDKTRKVKDQRKSK